MRLQSFHSPYYCSSLLCIALLLCNSSESFFIRSYVPPNSRCNSTVAIACFTELFSMIDEVCLSKEVSFRCVHYTFLDECFASRVGQCDSASVARAGTVGFKQAAQSCPQNGRSKSNEGSYPFIGSSYTHHTTPVSPHQLISTLGYLQTQCTLSKSKNCSSEHVHNIMTQCEERMKPAAGYFEYDRHRLLRVKMDTSKRLMIYDETDKERECLISIVTRCLCERMGFDVLCQVDCQQLEPHSPDEERLAWIDWKEARLVKYTAQSHCLLIILLFNSMLPYLFFIA
ncbi:hypothetical protein WR25_03712 [Diploscapter pachys]|uniref:Uncharacterized protein n=1 Tax=Diploscapter pachys TaxID=2018661 RepID=A0A2A2LNZ1_9BILA|nr:hypothetical protein WR25_03712 [Diploscapter pachys]